MINSVEPKVRLQGYGYNPFCSHSSRCLEVLVWQYFAEAFCAPKVRLKCQKWYGFKGFPSHGSHCSGGLFPQYSGVSPLMAHAQRCTQQAAGRFFAVCLRWIQEGFKGCFPWRRLNPLQLSFLGDSVQILGVSPVATLTFGL